MFPTFSQLEIIKYNVYLNSKNKYIILESRGRFCFDKTSEYILKEEIYKYLRNQYSNQDEN